MIFIYINMLQIQEFFIRQLLISLPNIYDRVFLVYDKYELRLAIIEK